MNTIRRNQSSVTTWLALIIISAALCLISPSTAEAAIAVDALSTGNDDDVDQLTVPHTTGSGNNRLMLISTYAKGGTLYDVSSLTYNGQSAEFVGRGYNGTNGIKVIAVQNKSKFYDRPLK